MLELEQEVSTADRSATRRPARNPNIQQRRIKTQVIVADGELLMLGGLIQVSAPSTIRFRSSATCRVGTLFKQKDDAISKTELLILITPHSFIIAEARDIANEWKRKLLNISTKAIARPHTIEQSTRRTLLDDTSVSDSLLDRASR